VVWLYRLCMVQNIAIRLIAISMPRTINSYNILIFNGF
jgi:hypothetical protein